MEIRNNTAINSTSFGMAFIKPEPDKMKAFAKYVMNDGMEKGRVRKINLAERGLKQLQKEHEQDANFDFLFDGKDSFIIKPMSDAAIEMLPAGEKVIMPKGGYPSALSEMSKELDGYIQNPPSSKFKQVLIGAKMCLKMLKARLHTYTKPQEYLPDSLRYASDRTAALEKRAHRQIERERRIDKALK